MHVVLLLQTLLSLSKLALLASDENNDAELEGKCQPTIVYELHFSLACGEPGLPLLNLSSTSPRRFSCRFPFRPFYYSLFTG